MRGIAAGLAIALLAAAAALTPAAAADLRIRVVDPKGMPLANAIVYAVPADPIPAGRPPSAIIDQIHRQFVPRVSVVQTGTEVDFPNSDNIRHSVYSFSPAKKFLLRLYAGKAAPPVLFDKPGIVVLGCEIHDSMVAWLLVVSTPYFGKSDAQGRVTLRSLRAGEYAVHAWHAPMRQVTAGAALRIAPAGQPAPVVIRLDDGGRPAAGAAMPGMAH